MKQRWLVAIVGVPVLLAVLLACPPWATMLLVCAMSGVAAYELLHVAGKSTDSVAIGLTVLLAVMQVSWGYLETQTGQMVFGGVSAVTVFRWALVVLLFFRAVMTYGKSGAVPFETVAAAIVGGIVFPAFYGCILLLRLRESGGRLYVLAPFVIAFVGDSLAMYFGKWFGKRKLTPVSPNKTWAGFFGNLLGSVLGMLLLGLVGSRWLGYEANYPMLALLGACANLLGQLGDLSTSLIKREAGVKDYSHLFLTHGGMLDRFDSTLFIAPAVYFFVSAGLV
ncbi:MAG: hypothetical protein E7422_06610 [Ruminococcaceae bacterium]|jgi:phosphatidate cytidylyltransferase|nr:hypothetical protein [Oscillospiraceae bacterium]